LTNKPRHRIYHGIDGNAEGNNTRILVVAGGGGPTERRDHTKVLYQLTPKEPFWWGYGGGSPSRTAEAIIDDVLPDLVADIPAVDDMPNSLRTDLIVAFLGDFVAPFHNDEEFWLPAQTVIRWVHGYFREARKS
jgi:hypothetical protein